MTPLALGIDGGGSATRWAVADAGGTILDHGVAPPISGHLFSDAERQRLAQSIATIPHRPTRVLAGITGLAATAPQAADAARIIAETLNLPAEAVEIHNDMWIAYHALFAPGEGHIVYAGTGAIALHIAADGTEIRAGGRGMLIDDAGSAFWIARTALDHIWRARDTNPSFTSPLAQALDDAIGGPDWDTHRTHIYSGGRNAVAQLARAVATADDPTATEILTQAGQELARLALALSARTTPKPTALIGRAATLHPAIEAGFRAAAPHLPLTLPTPDPAATAAKIAATRLATRPDPAHPAPNQTDRKHVP